MSRALPETIGPFEVLEELGRGGMGVVYLARQPSVGRLVAVKVLAVENPELSERLRREATVLGELQHPHIVSVVDVGEDGGYPYYAMAYCAGGSVGKVLERDGRMTAGQAVAVLANVAEALAALHSRGLVHRDVKPSNVLLSADGEPFLGDFGLATGDDTNRVTTSGAVLGTVGYSAPELLEGAEITPASDTFSLGVTGYQMLTGEMPFRGAHIGAVIDAVRSGTHRLLSEVAPDTPSELAAAVEEMLTTNAADRPQDLRKLAKRLRAAAPTESIEPIVRDFSDTGTIVGGRRARSKTEPSTATSAPSEGSGGRRKVLIGATSLMSIAAVVGVLVVVAGGGGEKAVATTSAYELPRVEFANGVTVDRTWTLTEGKRIDASVLVTNPGETAVVHQHDEVVPKAMASSVDDITFSQDPDSVVNPDPIVRHCLSLDPDESLELTYSVKASGATTDDLQGLSDDWTSDTQEQLDDPGGEQCPGIELADLVGTLDDSEAGVVTTLPNDGGNVAIGGGGSGGGGSTGGGSTGGGSTGGGSTGGGSTGGGSGGGGETTTTTTKPTTTTTKGTTTTTTQNPDPDGDGFIGAADACPSASGPHNGCPNTAPVSQSTTGNFCRGRTYTMSLVNKFTDDHYISTYNYVNQGGGGLIVSGWNGAGSFQVAIPSLALSTATSSYVNWRVTDDHGVQSVMSRWTINYANCA